MKELQELAKEKGFRSQLEGNYLLGGLWNYLYDCELQKWLREKHGLYAFIDYENMKGKIINYKDFDGAILYSDELYCDTNKQDLEELLLKSLKLIES
jgi:hypothetical protein